MVAIGPTDTRRNQWLFCNSNSFMLFTVLITDYYISKVFFTYTRQYGASFKKKILLEFISLTQVDKACGSFESFVYSIFSPYLRCNIQERRKTGIVMQWLALRIRTLPSFFSVHSGRESDVIGRFWRIVGKNQFLQWIFLWNCCLSIWLYTFTQFSSRCLPKVSLLIEYSFRPLFVRRALISFDTFQIQQKQQPNTINIINWKLWSVVWKSDVFFALRFIKRLFCSMY